jgi:hypothetical protein
VRGVNGLEWVLIVLPIAWLALVTAQQCARWRAVRRPADWQEGERRALSLLRELLSADEYASLEARGYLELPSRLHSRRRYRIYWRPRPVEVYEGARRVQALCLVPTSYLPPSDRVILHKVLLEGDERRYLRQANTAHLRRLHFPVQQFTPRWASPRQ